MNNFDILEFVEIMNTVTIKAEEIIKKKIEVDNNKLYDIFSTITNYICDNIELQDLNDRFTIAGLFASEIIPMVFLF